MRRLSDRVRDFRRRDDGVVMIMAAVLLVVLIGFAAFAIDVAALYQERRELQNGADAAALAIAEDCGRQTAPCDSATAGATAEVYADDNAEDDFSAVDEVDLDIGAQTVALTTSTEDAGGGAILVPAFARVLGWDGMTVHAGAIAAWGSPGGLRGLPLIISDCEWFDVSRPALQDEHPPFDGDPWLFVFHDGNHGGTCNHSNSGFDIPGGFGWLDTTGICEATTAKGAWHGADPGSSPANGCTSESLAAQVLNQVVWLPYYNDLTGTGNNDEYLVAGYGAFYVTGYNFGGLFKEPQGNVPCAGSTRCLEGYFVEATAYNGEFGGPDRGLVLVKLIG